MNEENILYIADANKTKPRKADDNLTNEHYNFHID